ncbi:unnamed protein product [Lactuca saligna]|uniref:HMA domain-containing protein n=1 Tax=Lactuca saligna TaxID=75948 RepID=A0AA36EGN1_LACSI|nr:unnamed protein product [Lactuca saligna]
MASKKSKNEYPAFTNFTIKVDVEGSWTKAVKKVLSSVQGVTNFRMENNGKVNISGYIDPTLLLKSLEKAGKTAEIVHWQYGECSTNLFEKTESPLPLPLPPINNNLYLLEEGGGTTPSSIWNVQGMLPTVVDIIYKTQ